MIKLLWSPTKNQIEDSQAWEFIQKINKKFNTNLENFHDLYKWSCICPESFWELFSSYSRIIVDKKSKKVLKNGEDFLKSEWFSDSKLNFAKNLLSKRDQTPAIIFWGEDKHKSSLTHDELYNQVARLSHWLKKSGVVKGDRVAGLLPNMAETVVSMLATSSIGAIWTSCSPDFGVQGVLDRFGQVKPKVFICVDAYLYNGKVFNCLEKNA